MALVTLSFLWHWTFCKGQKIVDWVTFFFRNLITFVPVQRQLKLTVRLKFAWVYGEDWMYGVCAYPIRRRFHPTLRSAVNSTYQPFCSFRRYGSQLVLVETFSESNITETLASDARGGSNPDGAFWLGLRTLNDLTTNTLESASGEHVSLYSGNYATIDNFILVVTRCSLVWIVKMFFTRLAISSNHLEIPGNKIRAWLCIVFLFENFYNQG